MQRGERAGPQVSFDGALQAKYPESLWWSRTSEATEATDLYPLWDGVRIRVPPDANPDLVGGQLGVEAIEEAGEKVRGVLGGAAEGFVGVVEGGSGAV